MSFKSLNDILGNFETSTRRTFTKYRRAGQKPPSSDMNEAFDFISLIGKWGSIIGEKMTMHTLPHKLSRGTLFIYTSHPIYADKLSYLSEGIKEKIFQQFPYLKGKIKTIKYTATQHFDEIKKQQAKISQEKNPQIKKKTNLRYSPLYQELKKAAVEEFKDIDDDELKEQLISLFIQGHMDQPG